jgi:surface carbohydrate biosynthesis protein
VSSQFQKYLTIPVETINREFDAKLLLACYAAKSGFAVIIGSKYEVHHKLDVLPRSIYIGKSLTEKNRGVYRRLKKLGHFVASTDEEALVYFSPEHYWQTKVGSGAFHEVEAFLAWGPENAQIWQRYPTYQGAPLYVTGSPRIDLLRPELQPFWSDEVQEIRTRFNRFILVNTNFGQLNHYRPSWSGELRTLRAVAANPSAVDEFAAGVAAHRFALFERFQAMARVLARAYPDVTIVIRPHPSESHEVWHQATSGCSNVRVIHEGNVAPWLLAAGVMIHNGCTTGIEAYLLGVAAIAYQPVRSERFDKHLPNGLSHQAFDLEALQAFVGAALNGRLQTDPQSALARRHLLNRYIASVEGPLASVRVVQVLHELANTLSMRRSPSWRLSLVTKVGEIRRRFKKRRKAFFHRDALRHQYHQRLFPDMSLSDVQSRIARFQSVLGCFTEIGVRRVSKNMFEIRARY